ncbi:MAG: cupin-like domain-containing protein [Betaproteobacteria bacterium]
MASQKLPVSSLKLREIALNEIGCEALFRFCIAQNEPVVITGIFDAIPELERWSPDWMQGKLKNKAVMVRESDSRTFAVGAISREMPFDQYVDTICDPSFEHSTKRLYMQQQSIDQALPELKADVYIDKFLPEKKIFMKSLWFGPGGNTSPLHFDPFDNIFFQLYGTKRFYIFDPKDYSKLYSGSWLSTTPHISGIDPVNVDLTQHPLAAQATLIEVEVKPGTALILPSYWWHQVYSERLSISINIWLMTNFFKLCPGAINMLPLNARGFSMMYLQKFKSKFKMS